MSTTPPELSRIKSVRVPRRMYVSKFQRYGGAAIVVVLAVAVGAGILPKADRQERLEEKRRLERETWCDVGDARLDPGLPGRPGPVKFDRCTTVAARRADHRADAWSLSGRRIPMRVPRETAAEPRPRLGEPRVERGVEERASRPPIHESCSVEASRHKTGW